MLRGVVIIIETFQFQDRLATLREQYDVVQSDVVRFDNYIKELESFVNIQETKLAETEEDMAALSK